MNDSIRISSAPLPPLTDRTFGLDVCRTLAILLVVFGHTLQHSKPASTLAEFGMVGLFGVDLFFCLSGFLIGRILLAESMRWPEDHERGIFRFWYRRWMRTLPLFFFYFFVSLKYDWRGETTISAQLPYLFFAQNLAWPMPDFFHLSWSLAVEEWFYLTFPLLLLFIVGLGQTSKRAAVWTILIFILGPLLFRTFLPAHISDLRSFDEGLRQVVLFRLDAIGFGVLMAYLYMWHRPLFNRIADYWWLFLALVASCIGLTKFGYPGMADSIFLPPLYFIVSAFSFAMLIPRINSLRPTRFRLVNRFVKHTSLVSYSLYLGHIFGFMIVLRVLHRLGIFDTLYPNPWVTYPLLIGTAYLVATVTYYAIEKPVLDLRDRRSRGAFHPVTTPSNA